jgi:Flp pilus assembly pilin Flp
MRIWVRWLRDASGATSIEYSVIASLLAVGIVTCVNTMGAKVGGVFAALSVPGAPPPGGPNNGS